MGDTRTKRLGGFGRSHFLYLMSGSCGAAASIPRESIASDRIARCWERAGDMPLWRGGQKSLVERPKLDLGWSHVSMVRLGGELL
jgi:hypothetical protein